MRDDPSLDLRIQGPPNQTLESLFCSKQGRNFSAALNFDVSRDFYTKIWNRMKNASKKEQTLKTKAVHSKLKKFEVKAFENGLNCTRYFYFLHFCQLPMID